MADYATHYWNEPEGDWETAWFVNEELARAEATRLIKKGYAKEVFISVEVARAFTEEVVIENIN